MLENFDARLNQRRFPFGGRQLQALLKHLGGGALSLIELQLEKVQIRPVYIGLLREDIELRALLEEFEPRPRNLRADRDGNGVEVFATRA